MEAARRPQIITGWHDAVLRMAVALLLTWGGPAQGTPESGHAISLERPRWLVTQALAYEHGEGVPKDPLRAAELYCEAARLGDAEAQYSLGWMYANGRGLKRDNVLAGLFFGMAAEQGHAQAQRMLRFVGAREGVEMPECMRETPREAVRFEDEPDLPFFDESSPRTKKVIELVRRLAPEYAVDPRLALAVISAESNFEPTARSPKNAQGLMQLIPETAERFNVRNAFDPVQNIRGGLAYLRWLLAYFRGDVALVAAGYNAGEGTVEKYRGIPPYRETQAYVRKILGYFRRQMHPFDERVVDPSPMLLPNLGTSRKVRG